MKYLYISVALVIAMVILFMSVAKANLEAVMKEEKENKLRVVPINYVINKDNGEKITATYYLPRIKIYPTNVLYPIKIWRDKLWLGLTRDLCQKSKLLMLIADKQMAEEDPLSASEAVDKLIEAYRICPNNKIEVIEAAKAYRQITQKMRKYLTANEKIEEFIKIQAVDTD